MKISLIAPTYLPSRRANTIQVMKMAQAMVEGKFEVQVYVPKPHDQPEAGWNELAEHYGLSSRFEVIWLKCIPGLRSYDYALKAVRKAKQDKAELVYTRLPQAAALASQRGIPTIYEVHDLPRGLMGARLFRSCLRGRGLRRLVVITQALFTDLQAEFGTLIDDELTVIAPDGVDIQRYQDLSTTGEARNRLGSRIALGDRFTAGYTGHLYPGRGIDSIVEMAAELPEVNFLLAGGNDADVENYRDTAQSRGLENLIFTGFISNSDLPLYQAACNVFLMPYQKHVAASSGGDISAYLSPMKVFEYMASRRPILSSDLPVFHEVLNEENALLLPPEDLKAWISALTDLRDEPENGKILAERAFEDVQQYTWERRVQKIFEGIDR